MVMGDSHLSSSSRFTGNFFREGQTAKTAQMGQFCGRKGCWQQFAEEHCGLAVPPVLLCPTPEQQGGESSLSGVTGIRRSHKYLLEVLFAAVSDQLISFSDNGLLIDG